MFCVQWQLKKNKTNKMLGTIRKRIDNKTENILMPLHKSMVRTHLEYCMQFWSPRLKKDTLELEKVQRRTTKVIRNMDQLRYKERLKNTVTVHLRK